MKKYIINNWLFGLLVALPVLFFSCSDDESVSVTRVCAQKVTDTETVLTKVRLGEKIRIEGSGFTTTKAIYCNGVEVAGVNSNYITDNAIIFTIPTTIPTGTKLQMKRCVIQYVLLRNTMILYSRSQFSSCSVCDGCFPYDAKSR